ncbi:PEGA domain-containing protein [Patescibacteria group bacterium]
MNLRRAIIILATLLVVGVGLYFLSQYAKGYRFNSETMSFSPSGLVVVKSNPEAARIFIDGEFNTVTNNNISVAPGTYDFMIKKEGFHDWGKRVKIEKEVVTELDAQLFSLSPSLSAITFTASLDPKPTSDFTKIGYIVPATIENINQDKEGLWAIETVNLPIGFVRDPRRITNGDLEKVSWEWSPDGRQILLQSINGSYLLDAGDYTPQKDRVNITSSLDKILTDWEEESQKRINSQFRGLPDEIKEVLENAKMVQFSPDEKRVMYTATAEVTLSDNLIKPVPGANAVIQNRHIKKDHTYVYSIKDDTNYLILEDSSKLLEDNPKEALMWFPTSRNLIYAKGETVIIMDSDGTNKQEVFSGSYVAPNAFPVASKDRLIILTNLGANSNPPNLYSLSIK